MKICLTMIVKNEAHIIERALESARPMIDSFCILDTGSSDGTQPLIAKVLENVPGVVIDTPWEGFGPTRTKALQLAQEGWGKTGFADLALILDADDYLENAQRILHMGSDLDLYELTVRHGTLTYRKPHLLRLSKPWRYVGRTHEFLTCDAPFTSGHLDSPIYVCTADGARRKDSARKSLENIEALRIDIQSDPANKSRWTFYLAQEHKDAGDFVNARYFYELRGDMDDGWDEERWCARFEQGLIEERLGHLDMAEETYGEAFHLRPWRAETLVAIARFSRNRGFHSTALVYARAACHTPFPRTERLFLDQSYYGWRRLQELGLALHNTGQHAAAIKVFECMMDDHDLPFDVAAQTQKNIDFCRAALRR